MTMDKLQIQHALDQIELHGSEIKKYLLSTVGDEVEELENEVRYLKGQIEELEDEASESFDLQNRIDAAIDLLSELKDGSCDDVLSVQSKISEIIKTLE